MPKPSKITPADLHRASGAALRTKPQGSHPPRRRTVTARQFDSALTRELARRTVHTPTFNEGSEP
jgi:hypothetical protein